MAKGRRLTAE